MNNIDKSPDSGTFRFRFHTEEDIPLLYEKHCKSHWEILKFPPMPLDRFVATIKRFEARENIPFIIADAKTNYPIGQVCTRISKCEQGLQHIVGIQLWDHMEYADDVVIQLLATMFSNDQIDSVRWTLSQRLSGWISIACDIGMHYIGTVPKYGKSGKTNADEYIYAIDRCEWEQRQQPNDKQSMG